MPSNPGTLCAPCFRLQFEASRKMAEEEDFVLVERAESDDDDDAVSVSSSRSSLCLVEDPRNDSLMLNGESPLKRSVAPPPDADEEAVDREAPLPPSTEADVPIPEVPEEKVLSLAVERLS